MPIKNTEFPGEILHIGRVGGFDVKTPIKMTGSCSDTYNSSIIEIIDKNVRHYQRLNAAGLRLELKFKHDDGNKSNLEGWIRNCLSDLLLCIKSELQVEPQDRVGFVFTNNNNVKISFSISFRRFDQYTADVLLAELSRVIQSNSNFFIDDTLIVNVDHVKIPLGYGRRFYVGKSKEDFFKIHKRSIFSPDLHPEHYGLCLASAIVISIGYIDGPEKYNELTYRGNYDMLIAKSIDLCSKANVDLSFGGGIDEIIKFQNYLGTDYRITVFNSRDGKSIYFKSCHENYIYTINLLLDDFHYCVILKATAVFASAYFCSHCSVAYTTKFGHKRCPVKCNYCFTFPSCVKVVDTKCSDCNRVFPSTECFHKHLIRNVCDTYKLCIHCCTIYNNKKTKSHICGVSYCRICKDEMPIRHQCYMPVTKIKKTPKNGDLYIFYDLESVQTKPLKNDPSKREHEANLCIAHQACDLCRDIQNIQSICGKCGQREHLFERNDVIHNFMTYVGNIGEKFTRIFLIAHNAQKYDAHFILKYMYMHSAIWRLTEDSLIMHGTKILRIKIGRYNFIDSLNFFNVALAKLPSMFSLENNSKGYYPHFFNTHENFDYIGPLPDIKYYGCDQKKTKERNEFIDWYNTEKLSGKIFNNRHELIKYCREDVNILRNACLKFRSILYEITKIEPFYQVTLAGTAMTIYTTMFYKENSISIIPRNGYRFTDNQSFKAIKWLEWESHKRNIKIHTAANGREVRIASDILVDGFYPPNTVYSFLGCYWHQCPKCFPHQYHRMPKSQTNIRSLYENYLERAQKIKNMGYILIEMWEHEFDVALQSNQELISYINTLDHLKVAPLNPRDSFMGGRTGLCKLYYKTRPNEKIYYNDVTSLYPYINKYGKYPIGEPKILLGQDLIGRTVFNIDGLIKVDILPPRALYHPVLGIRMHSKLLMPLCFTCSKEKSTEKCTHSDCERMIHGTYVADELRLAVQKGYEVLKIYEAWEYNITQYNKSTETGGLFTEYIDTFLKIKTEASGYPAWCVSPHDQAKYIQKFFEHEGIQLDPEQIEKNPGYRSLAKLFLNSLWGRLGMRADKDRKIFVKNSQQLLNLITNPSYDVNSFYELDQDSLLVSYKMREDCVEMNSNVNVVLASYTTAQARIYLYKYLDELQERCLYYDTDSVIYTCKDDEKPLSIGDYLGDLTDELSEFGIDSYITEAVFTSEKSYAFIVKSPQNNETNIVCKVKGIHLNYDNSKHVNFESMKNLVLSDQSKTIALQNDIILRDSSSNVYTSQQSYKYKVNATKRVKIGDLKIDTLPYGY